MEYFDKAIESSPNDPKIHNWRAWALMAQQKFSEAEASFRKARSLDPSNRIQATEAALPAIYAGDYARAETLLNEALALDQNFFQARFRKWYLEIAKKNYEEALREARKTKGSLLEMKTLYI